MISPGSHLNYDQYSTTSLVICIDLTQINKQQVSFKISYSGFVFNVLQYMAEGSLKKVFGTAPVTFCLVQFWPSHRQTENDAYKATVHTHRWAK